MRSLRTSASPSRSLGAAARTRSGRPRSRATSAHAMRLTAWARSLVSRPAPKWGKRGWISVDTASPSTASPRKASRSHESLRRSTHEACVTAWVARSSGSSSMRSLSVFRATGSASARALGRVGEDVVDRLPDGDDAHRLLVGDAHAVVVLELHDERHEVERVGVEVLLEARALLDALGIDLELRGEVRPHELEDLVPGHDSTLAPASDRSAPADASASAVRSTMRSSTARRARRMALAMPSGLEPPWAITTGRRSPSRTAPPIAFGSSSRRRAPRRPRASRPPKAATGEERIAVRTAPPTVFAVPSMTLSATLPVNPSV